MIQVKLPSSSEYHASPSGDTEYESAYKQAIFDAKPEGFEVSWPKIGHRWPIDSEGFTFVPLYLSQTTGISQADMLTRWISRYQELEDKMTAIMKKGEELIELIERCKR